MYIYIYTYMFGCVYVYTHLNYFMLFVAQNQNVAKLYHWLLNQLKMIVTILGTSRAPGL